MTEIGVQDVALLTSHLVVCGEVGAWRRDGVHQPTKQLDLPFNAVGEVLQVDVTELPEDFRLSLVPRVSHPEVVSQLVVGVLCQVHLPDSLVVTKKWINRGGFLDGCQCGAGDCQSSALRAAHCSQP